MALNIRNAHAEKLAADLAKLTGESKTEAVTKALQDRLDRMQRQRRKRSLAERLNEIATHCAGLAILNKKSPEELLYDKNGLPR